MKEVAQSLQEARGGARKIEMVMSSFEPLTDNETLQELEEIEKIAIDLSFRLKKLYNQVAPVAFGEAGASR